MVNPYKPPTPMVASATAPPSICSTGTCRCLGGAGPSPSPAAEHRQSITAAKRRCRCSMERKAWGALPGRDGTTWGG